MRLSIVSHSSSTATRKNFIERVRLHLCPASNQGERERGTHNDAGDGINRWIYNRQYIRYWETNKKLNRVVGDDWSATAPSRRRLNGQGEKKNQDPRIRTRKKVFRRDMMMSKKKRKNMKSFFGFYNVRIFVFFFPLSWQSISYSFACVDTFLLTF
jgi:hypothetical protein